MDKCKKKGYHDWEVVGVNSSLPEQEVELVCKVKGCKATHTSYFSFEDDDE
jgi:hypothetical protein